jgi:hypothetical protein
MEIANRDLKLILIKEAIKDNNKFVIQKIIKLKKAQRENELLSVIYNDYKKYYDHMFNEKIREKAQLLFLSKYLEKSIKNIGLTDSEICKVKHSQKNILHNLDRVRSDLEDFVDRNN